MDQSEGPSIKEKIWLQSQSLHRPTEAPSLCPHLLPAQDRNPSTATVRTNNPADSAANQTKSRDWLLSIWAFFALDTPATLLKGSLQV